MENLTCTWSCNKLLAGWLAGCVLTARLVLRAHGRCLRLLEDYRTAQREVAAGTRTLKCGEDEVFVKFEKGIGELLKNAWMHAEALQVRPRACIGWWLRGPGHLTLCVCPCGADTCCTQTTDLPLLISHTGDVLGEAADTEVRPSAVFGVPTHGFPSAVFGVPTHGFACALLTLSLVCSA